MRRHDLESLFRGCKLPGIDLMVDFYSGWSDGDGHIVVDDHDAGDDLS